MSGRIKEPNLPQSASTAFEKMLVIMLYDYLRDVRVNVNQLRDDVVAIDLSGVAYVALANVFTKAQSVTPVALTDAASIATDASLSNTFTVTLAGNRTLANPTSLTNGGIYNWRVRQDAVGSRTLTYGLKFKWPGGTAPTLTTTASATDFISGQYFSDTDVILCTSLKAFA